MRSNAVRSISSVVTISSAAESWAAHLNYLGRAPRTLSKYESCLEHFAVCAHVWGFSKLDSVTAETVEQFVGKFPAPASRAKALSILRQFFGFCLFKGWCDANPASGVASPKVRGMSSPTPLSADASYALLARFSEPENRKLWLLAKLMLETGIRLGDALRLDLASLQGDRLAFRTEKTNGQVPAIPLSADLAAGLRAHALDGKVFLRPGVELASLTRDVQRKFKAAFVAVGVPEATIHWFRHSFASHLAAKGATTDEIAMILGISPAVARKTYIHFTAAWQNRLKTLLE
jgi:site-specific recombinase XerD